MAHLLQLSCGCYWNDAQAAEGAEEENQPRLSFASYYHDDSGQSDVNDMVIFLASPGSAYDGDGYEVETPGTVTPGTITSTKSISLLKTHGVYSVEAPNVVEGLFEIGALQLFKQLPFFDSSTTKGREKSGLRDVTLKHCIVPTLRSHHSRVNSDAAMHTSNDHNKPSKPSNQLITSLDNSMGSRLADRATHGVSLVYPRKAFITESTLSPFIRKTVSPPRLLTIRSNNGTPATSFYNSGHARGAYKGAIQLWEINK